MQFGFIGSTYQHSSVKFDTQRCINIYPEKSETGSSKSEWCLLGTAGLQRKVIVTPNTGNGCRGAYTTNDGRSFWVFGDTLFELNTDFTITNRGTLLTGSEMVKMSDNGTHLIVIDGLNGWKLVLSTNVLSQITDAGFPQPISITELDGYFLISERNTNNVYVWISTSAFDASLVAQAEASADKVTGLIANDQNVFVFGEDTIEIWYDSGNADYPFDRLSGGVVEVGCIAKDTIARGLGAIFFLGGNKNGHGIIYKMSGYTPIRISTHAIEEQLSSMSLIGDSSAYCYQEQGHYFYVISFPTGKKTFCYDDTTGQWHERLYNDSGTFDRHRGIAHSFFSGINLLGDHSLNYIYEYDVNKYTDDGIEIIRERVCPHIHNELKRLFYSSFEIDMEVGVGLSNSTTYSFSDATSVPSAIQTLGAHALVSGHPIVFSVVPTGLTIGTIYYCLVTSPTTFSVSLTRGGSAVTIGSASSLAFVSKSIQISGITVDSTTDTFTFTDHGMPSGTSITFSVAPAPLRTGVEYFIVSSTANTFKVSETIGGGAINITDNTSATMINNVNRVGYDPQIMMQYSNDGGYTWSDELWQSIGKQGERKSRVKWSRLGQSRDRVFKVRISDPIKVALINAEIEVESGQS